MVKLIAPPRKRLKFPSKCGVLFADERQRHINNFNVR
jgi:hypothetical protein